MVDRSAPQWRVPGAEISGYQRRRPPGEGDRGKHLRALGTRVAIGWLGLPKWDPQPASVHSREGGYADLGELKAWLGVGRYAAMDLDFVSGEDNDHAKFRFPDASRA